MKPITIPVDDLPGLRAFAAEWLGGMWPIAEAWTEWRDHGKPVCAVLPLHIPAGYALGLALLAKRHGVASLRLRFHKGQWLLLTEDSECIARLPAGVVPEHCGTCGGSGSKYFDEDAHSVGCCEACGGSGTNPTRAAEALRACLATLQSPDEASD